MNGNMTFTRVNPIERTIYGCSIADFKESIEESFTFRVSGPEMIVASLMSDAQEEMSRGLYEAARQTMNRAKWVLSNYCMKDRV